MSGEKTRDEPRYLAHANLRDGQREMIQEGISALEEEGFLLANAPTGLGKTAAALSAALNVARNRSPRPTILFMTGRQAQHRIVVDTVRQINERRNIENEDKVSLVDMIGQRGMCIHQIAEEWTSSFHNMCSDLRRNRQCKPYLADSPGLRLRVLQDPLHVDELVSVSRSHHESGSLKQTCPWKVARECASSADIVVCDYNHLFNERVRDSSLKGMGIDMSNLLLIIDEAHNLPERIRMGLRARLTPDLIRNAVYELEEHRETLQEQYEKTGTSDSTLDDEEREISTIRLSEATLTRTRLRLAQWFKEQREMLQKEKPGKDENEKRVKPSQVLKLFTAEMAEPLGTQQLTIEKLMKTLWDVQVDHSEDDDAETDNACERLASVLENLSRFEDDPAICVAFRFKSDTSHISTHLLDPSVVSAPVFDSVRGAVLMSGTLTPPEMYAHSLGIPEGRMVTAASYQSPFEADRRPVIIANGVSTLYARRGRENTRKIQKHIHALLRNTPGHVVVFCPSYAILQDVIGSGDWPGRWVVVEEPGWSKKKVDDIQEQLRSARIRGQKILLGGVFGGRLAEGVDYAENVLDAVCCVGIPNAPMSVENDALKEYIGKDLGRSLSWRYAVFQPAVNKVLQGMGRAIRKADDRAFMLLLDDRLNTPNYKGCLPPTMSHFESKDAETTGRFAKRFFARHPEPASHEE